ncbi:MAG: MMPL family transporter, partial [Acidimicrobiia bacterium]|nr:MMPL family transporter [Acidimicrobiia bacterium]
MKTLVNGLSRLTVKWPWPTLIAILVVSFVLAGFSFQAVISDGNDGFAPDAEELLAADRISELFGEDSTVSVLQVLVSAEDGDALDLDGLATVRAILGAIDSSDLAPLLAERPEQPSVISYMLPLQQALADGAPEPTTDADLKAAYNEAVSNLPDDLAGISSSLLSADQNLDASSASKGLVLVFINAPAFDGPAIDEFDPTVDFEDFMDVESDLAASIQELDLPAGYSAEPFSIELIFATGDEFQEEIGRLFGFAAMIIVFILLFVFWMKPIGVRRLVSFRRSAADMGLTMATIFLAIFWMNGFGVLLGPKYLGLVNDFGPMTQIIPILLIGLGVDYAIHLSSRYREEASDSANPVGKAMEASMHTVGVALVLATVTTSVGFLTNLVSPIPALKDFGLLAAIGIGASFLLMMTFVASARILLDRRAEAGNRLPRQAFGETSERSLPKLIGRTAWLAEKVPVLTVTAALALGAVGAYGVTQLSTEFSFTDFVPRPNALIPTFETLVDEFGGGFGETSQIIIEGDVATAANHNAMVDSFQNLSGTENVVLFGDAPAAQSPLSVLASLIDPDSPSFDEGVAAAARTAGIGDGSFMVSANADVDGLYDAMTVADLDNTSRFLHRDAGSFSAVLFDITTRAGESGASQLNDDLRVAFEPVAAAGLSAVPTSDEIINSVVIASLQSSQVSSLAITVFAAMVLLMINFMIESR